MLFDDDDDGYCTIFIVDACGMRINFHARHKV